MRTRTYDNDPDRPDDNAAPPPHRFSVHPSLPTDAPTTRGTDAEAEAFIRINTKRNRERAAAWLESWGIDP